MKTPVRPPLSAPQVEALQARFALRVSARLDDAAQALPHDITERLRVAREQAVRAALQARPQLAVATAPQFAPGLQPAGLSVAGGGSAGQAALSGWGNGTPRRDKAHGRRMDDGPLPWGWRLASVLPALVLVAGLWGIQSWYRSEKVEAATDVDMALLTDDLPPAAYADPGFEEYLRTDAPAVEAPPATEAEDPADEADDANGTEEAEAVVAEGDAPEDARAQP